MSESQNPPPTTDEMFTLQLLISLSTWMGAAAAPGEAGCRSVQGHRTRCATATGIELLLVAFIDQHTNLARSLDLLELDKGVSCPAERGGDGRGSLGFTLGADDRRLALLLCLFDDKLGALGVLLGDLLLLDCGCELLSEAGVSGVIIDLRHVCLVSAGPHIAYN